MNQMAAPKTGFSRRGFMIGIAGLTFAVAVGRRKIWRSAATEAPDSAPERRSIHGSASPPTARYRSWHRRPKWGRDR